MPLPDLPPELLLTIGNLLDWLRDINAMVRVNKRLYSHLNYYLYSVDVRTTGGSALVWAAKRELKRTAWLSLSEGADTEAVHRVKIPRPLRSLGFENITTYLTPFQIALCYGSDSVARLLIDRGADSLPSYPPELCSCTSLHMAGAMGLTSVLKALIDQGMNVEARDIQLRTPLHYALTVQHLEWPEQGRVVMWLLAKNADSATEDSQRRRPSSIGKKCSNPFVRVLFKKGVEVATYETLFYDHEVFEIRRVVKERHEEEAWAKEKNDKQLARERAILTVAKRESGREAARKKRAATEQRMAIVGSWEQGEMARRTEAQERALQSAKENAEKLAHAQRVVEEEARIENVRLERHEAMREAWSQVRKEADRRSQATTKSDLRAKSDCSHLSGLWRSKVRTTCQSCGRSMKLLSICPDCGFVVCKQCNSGKA